MYDEMFCSSVKEVYRYQEEQFKHDLLELFELSWKDALSVMTNEEDKLFLQMQRDDPSSASMALPIAVDAHWQE